ncbi:hypothetical protein Tco_0853759 [Tanacetum coccineum]
MATMAENVLAAGKENGEMLLDSIKIGPFQFKEITVPATETIVEHKRMQEVKDLSPEGKLRKSYDIKATNIILPGLSVDIYTLVNYHKIAREIYNRVKELMEGTKLTKQERESKLYDDFDKFTSKKGESIHSYYFRYANSKQAKNIHVVNFDQLYGYLKQNENEVRTMRQKFPDPLALLANTYNPPPSYNTQRSQYNPQPSELHPYQLMILSPQQESYEPPVFQQKSPAPSTQLDYGFVVPSFLPTNDPIASLNEAMMFLSTTTNSRFTPTNNQLKTLSNPRTQATIQDGKVTVHNV